jgi:hypothetical protein
MSTFINITCYIITEVYHTLYDLQVISKEYFEFITRAVKFAVSLYGLFILYIKKSK